ncbi:MAG: hypothetical protein GXO77_15205 [Calditrichaeota bacterium]|nr:hypothetical protein [Calditrichota bacterium]
MAASSKEERIREIGENIRRFCKEYLNSQYEGYALNLLEEISEYESLNIERGKAEIWAASIIHLIARLNFLFDKQAEDHIPAKKIREFFGVKPTTVGNKASLIENILNIRNNDTRFCSDDIADLFKFVETSDGFIIPLNALKEEDIDFDSLEEDFALELRAFFERKKLRIEKEKKRREEQRIKEAKKQEEARQKRIQQKKDKNQLDLFDDLG